MVASSNNLWHSLTILLSFTFNAIYKLFEYILVLIFPSVTLFISQLQKRTFLLSSKSNRNLQRRVCTRSNDVRLRLHKHRSNNQSRSRQSRPSPGVITSPRRLRAEKRVRNTEGGLLNSSMKIYAHMFGRYNITREVNTKNEPQFIIIEQYASNDALKVHGAAEPFKNLGRTLKKENLLAKPLAISFVKPIGGFDSRGGSKL